MERRICFIGDSLVNGYNDSTCKGWTGRLCEKTKHEGHDITLYNLGIRGDTSQDVLIRWQDEASPRIKVSSDFRVVFAFGVNDTAIEDGLMRVNLDETMEHMFTILSEARDSFPVLMIGPAPVDRVDQNRRVEVLAEQMGFLCGELEVPYLNMFMELSDNELWKNQVSLKDEVHPADEGYALYADIVHAWDGWQGWFE